MSGAIALLSEREFSDLLYRFGDAKAAAAFMPPPDAQERCAQAFDDARVAYVAALAANTELTRQLAAARQRIGDLLSVGGDGHGGTS